MRRWAVPVLAAAAVLVAGCSVDAPPPPTLVIGADVSLTGPNAAAGAVQSRALRLSVRTLDDQDGHHRYRLSLRDNRSDPATSVRNVRDLQRDRSVVAAVAGGCPGCLATLAPVVADGTLPVVSLSALDLPAASARRGSPLFKLAPNAADSAAALSTLLVDRHAGSVTPVVTDDGYGTRFDAALRSVADSRPFHLNDTVRLSGDPADAAETLLARDFPAPDAVVVAAPEKTAGALAAALHRRGYRGTVALDAAGADHLYLPERGLSGAFLVFPAILAMDDQVATTPAKAARRQWFDAYTSRYGSYDAGSGFAGDAVRVIAAGVTAAGGGKRSAVRAAIETSQLDGLSGPIRFTPDNHSALTPQSLVTLRDDDDRWHLAGSAAS